MYTDSSGKRLDLFCQVIDNFGDAGVCWRLARQLAGEYGFRVRLWIDKPEVLQKICPEILPDRVEQKVSGVSVMLWPEAFPFFLPDDIPDVVIEGFGARLPESYVRRMAERLHAPVWINLVRCWFHFSVIPMRRCFHCSISSDGMAMRSFVWYRKGLRRTCWCRSCSGRRRPEHSFAREH